MGKQLEIGSKASAKRRIRSFGKDRNGATVVEFALLAVPFSLLIFSVIESCVTYAFATSLQNAVDDLGRQFRTGQIPRDQYTLPTFKALFCKNMNAWLDQTTCPTDTKLKIDLRTFTTYQAAADAATSVKGGELDLAGGFQFKPGAKQTINMLRVYYEWPVFTSLLEANMSNWKDRYVLQFATATWQNEPFPDSAPPVTP